MRPSEASMVRFIMERVLGGIVESPQILPQQNSFSMSWNSALKASAVDRLFSTYSAPSVDLRAFRPFSHNSRSMIFLRFHATHRHRCSPGATFYTLWPTPQVRLGVVSRHAHCGSSGTEGAGSQKSLQVLPRWRPIVLSIRFSL